LDEGPSNEAFVLSLLEGYDAGEAEAMEIETPPPPREGLGAKYLAWIDRGASPRIGPRLGASPGKPSPLP
jgi:hypothetical protein